MKYVISDIHGEYAKLNKLIGLLDKTAEEYIFLGDYIDKGRRSKESIDLLQKLALRKKCIFIIGDHEYALLKYLEGEDRFLNFMMGYGGINTLESYLSMPLSEAEAVNIYSDRELLKSIFTNHLNFFAGLRFHYELNNEFICVHAGINPDDKDKPLELHNKEELVFIRDKFIYSGFLFFGKKVIFGHTAFKQPYVDGFKIGLDGGAAYQNNGYGNLLALDIKNMKTIDHNGSESALRP